MRQDQLCGLSFWHPKWLQQFATTKTFLVVYGLLGTVQAMSYMYFVVTLTTIEKRFKIPSQTTGIVLSGNEISQILLSLILSYAGGQRNRPRWISWGIVCCGLSCFILALPHFIYGPGDETLQLTKEYGEHLNTSAPLVVGHHLCYATQHHQECDNQLTTIVPLVLIFLSQFVLGIGNTLYYSLGQTYIDDNTKKTNTPMLLAFAMALRLIGPIVGFQLGYASLNMFIDPTKTPLIDRNDPRWLGAWWFGWMILGSIMLLFSGLVGIFPKKLPTKSKKKFHSEMPKALKKEYLDESAPPLHGAYQSTSTLDQVMVASTAEFPKLKDFPSALLRLLNNKLLMFNIFGAIFYILGASGYMTFLSKYMEVQFQKSAQNATVLIGPVTLIGMIIGLVVSGLILSKRKPSPSKVLFWNVLVGFVFVFGETSYFFLYCGDTNFMVKDGRLNVSYNCNANCSCEGVPYSPVCHESSETTYFSPCHAGCRVWDSKKRLYSNCTCLQSYGPEDDFVVTESYYNYYTKAYTNLTETDTMISETTSVSEPGYESTEDNALFVESTSTAGSEGIATPIPLSTLTTTQHPSARRKRSNQNDYDLQNITPGPCLKGCALTFYVFAFVSMVIHLFGSSGRVGNLLVNYRAVSTEDKSFAQGLALMLVSLFALIPGPIIYGWIIDQTCLVWTQNCSRRGYCQLYDQKSFRHYINIAAIGFTAIGVGFDTLVWYYGRHLDLYGEKEQQRLKEIQRKNRTITPLLSQK